MPQSFNKTAIHFKPSDFNDKQMNPATAALCSLGFSHYVVHGNNCSLLKPRPLIKEQVAPLLFDSKFRKKFRNSEDDFAKTISFLFRW